MKPHIIVNIQNIEKRLEKLYFQTYGNDVHELTTNMSNLREQIVTQLGNKNAYNDNILLTIIFQDLAQRTNPNFGLTVKLEKPCRVKGTNMDVSDIIRGFNTSFKNSVGDGIWEDTDARDQKIISLTKKLNHLYNKGSKAVGSTPGTSMPNKDCHACPGWCINKKGETSKYLDSGAPMAWCPHHKSKNGVVNGIYMPKGHNHNDWVVKRTNHQADCNVNKREGKGASIIFTVNTPTKRKTVSKLELYKSFKSVLVTKLQLSDRETHAIFDGAMADYADKDFYMESLKD